MAETVLVTGASGTLGTKVVERLRARGYHVREAGRSGPVRLDLATGEGIPGAVAGASVIVHAATNPLKDSWKTDVEGTKALLDAARQASVRHIVYPGIVGTERVQGFPYYRVKLAAEAAVKACGV
ncbi:MAG: NAD(P)H-binding protein, partial [Candidatus Dormibacteraeota bacterium]|nr:NAD(P)H-binding protein [Candidatus Dormibacteraeota bacterium]